MMQDYSVNDIILNKEQSESLIDNILHPQDDVLDRRDAFLAEVQSGIWQHHTESSFSVELPNLDLSFINSSETERGEIIQSLEFNLKEPDVYTNLVGKANINRTSPKRLHFFDVENEKYYPDNLKAIEYTALFCDTQVA